MVKSLLTIEGLPNEQIATKEINNVHDATVQTTQFDAMKAFYPFKD